MPGGKKNIRPEDGKQFSKDYQPPEKWTEEVALKLGRELLDWLKEKDEEDKDKGNIFIIDFLAGKEKSRDLPTYLANKFSSFSELLEKAKTIQEAKLVKYGVADRLNASMTKFCLINHHGYYDKQHIDHTSKGESINYSNISDDELISRIGGIIAEGKKGGA